MVHLFPSHADVHDTARVPTTFASSSPFAQASWSRRGRLTDAPFVPAAALISGMDSGAACPDRARGLVSQDIANPRVYRNASETAALSPPANLSGFMIPASISFLPTYGSEVSTIRTISYAPIVRLNHVTRLTMVIDHGITMRDEGSRHLRVQSQVPRHPRRGPKDAEADSRNPLW